MKKFLTGAAVAAMTFGLTAVSAQASDTIVDIAAGDERFSTLVEAVVAAGLADTLAGDGPFTVFAPVNDAFAALPEGTVEGLLADPDALAQVLTYHVVPGTWTSDMLPQAVSIMATVQGSTVEIDATDGVTVDGANVIIADIQASNGVIHVIDGVILP